MESPRSAIERSPANRSRKSNEVAHEHVEVEPRNPIAIPSLLLTIGRGLKSVLTWIAPFAVVYGLTTFFLGETTITTTLDGKPVKAQVWVNGDFVSDTPYTTRLGFGRVEVVVLPPENSDTNESEWRITMWSSGVGKDIPADFTSISNR